MVIAAAAVAGCAASKKCDPEGVKAFQSLPPVEGVEVDPHVSSCIGCTDTVEPPDPDAFVAHYARAMRDAGCTVVPHGDGFSGKGPAGVVRVDRLEGKDVRVYLLSPEDYPPKDR